MDRLARQVGQDYDKRRVEMKTQWTCNKMVVTAFACVAKNDEKHLKVHKREKFFGSDFEFFTIL
jgi:hypothetical protein